MFGRGKLDYIRDPVHSFMPFEDWEQKLMQTAPMRRLRNIRQLGLTYLVYPGAEHSRFQHSLGVCHLAGELFDRLAESKQLEKAAGMSEREVEHWRRVLRAAALLHDVGHPPFSHAVEDLLPEEDHERVSARIITEHREVRERLEEGHVCPEHVAYVVCDATEFPDDPDLRILKALRAILAGDIGVDRLDYLLRDSLFTGVKYGIYDLDRLLLCLALVQHPEEDVPVLAVTRGGYHVAEAVILCRYFMFTQVYFHRTRRAYDLMLREYLKHRARAVPQALDDYLSWDDAGLWTELREDARGHKNEWAQRIWKREHLRQVAETSEHPTDDEVEAFEEAVEEARKNWGDERLFVDEAAKAPYGKHFEQEIMALDDTGEAKLRPLKGASALLPDLKPIHWRRVYCRPEDREDLSRFFKNRLE